MPLRRGSSTSDIRGKVNETSWNCGSYFGGLYVAEFNPFNPLSSAPDSSSQKGTRAGWSWETSTVWRPFHSRMPCTPVEASHKVLSAAGRGGILVSLAQTPKPRVAMASPPGGQMAPLHRSPSAGEVRKGVQGFSTHRSPSAATSGTGIGRGPEQQESRLNGKREVRVSPS